jgi:hypothetical protein
LQVRQKRTKKAHRGGFEASPNPSGDLLLEKVSKKGKGGKRIVWGGESGEAGWIATHRLRLVRNDNGLVCLLAGGD